MNDIIYTKQSVFQDDRGFFLETYRESSVRCKMVQTNHSFSKKGVLRGLHWQKGQAKYLYVIEGEIYDVVVDLRTGEYRHFILSGQGHETLFVPAGYAHGFCVLSEKAHVLYQVSAYYDPTEEKSCRYDDPELAIHWPISDPIVSKRDQSAMSYREARQLIEGVKV